MSAASTNPFRVYFAGSIRGGRHDAPIYKHLVNIIQAASPCSSSSPAGFDSIAVLTEHVADPHLNDTGEKGIEISIYERDMKWLKSAHIMIAEVTVPSLGVGYELAQAHVINIPILCLYRTNNNGVSNSLSAMIRGAHDGERFQVVDYEWEWVEEASESQNQPVRGLIEEFIARNSRTPREV
eukprot:Nk52_evm1s2564 gene=Nk52_evmTU1s2564